MIDVPVIDYAALLGEQEPAFQNPARPVAPKPRQQGRRYWIGPEGQRPPDADEAFHPEREFAELFARSKLPFESPHKGGIMVGPLRLTGSCLAPLFVDGDLCYYDPTQAAADGDFVLVRDSEATLQRAIRVEPERYAAGISNLCVKWLRHFAGSLFLVFNTGCYPLGDDKILGVLRYAERREPAP